jgi:filamentous hemagglutinin family protein
MATNINRLRGALLASTSLVAGIGGLVAGASTTFAQNILPTNGIVSSGVASIRQSGAAMSVTQTSPRAIVNWGSFSIGPANGVTFAQPSAFSAILNRVTGSTTSTIAGQLQGNGQVYLVNPNGIAITKTGAVQVGGGFVASTLGIADSDFNKGNLNFVGKGASAGVSNAGSIAAAAGGFVGLIGGTVSNSGVVSVPLGKVAMGSGEQATLNLTGDNFLQVAIPTNTKTADGQALIDVSGKVRAAGGSVQLKAATVAQAIRNAVNVPGELSVTSARASGGSIILGGGPGGDVSVAGRLRASGRTAGGTIAMGGHDVALRQAKLAASSAKGKGGSVTITATNAISLASTKVEASGATGGGAIRIGGDFRGASDLISAQTTTIDSASTLNARAMASGNGGTVAVWSDATTNFAGRITATGGPSGGDGGSVEVSANPATHGVLAYSGFADLTAPKGTAGTLLLDPFNITICAASLLCVNSGGSFSGGVYTPNPPPPETSVITTATLVTQLGGANVVVSTGLAGSPGTDAGNLTVSAPITWASNNSLTLEAASGLSVQAPITSTAGGQLILNGGSFVDIGSPISTAAGGMTVTGPAIIFADVSSSSGAITFNDAVQFETVEGEGRAITTSGGAIAFRGAVTLEASAILNAGSGAITVGGAIDTGPSNSCAGGCDLTVTGGTINLAGALGGSSPLGSVSLTSTTDTTATSIAATRDITLSAGGSASILGPISTTGGDTTITGATGIALGGNVTANGDESEITFNNQVQLRGDVSVNATGVSFGSTVDSDPAFPGSSLAVNAGFINLNGALGGTNPLGAVSLTQAFGTLFLPSITAIGNVTLTGGAVEGPFPIELTGNISTSGGGVTFNNAVGLLSNVTVSAPSGPVTFANTVDTGFSNSCDVACDLTVSASTINFGGALGGQDDGAFNAVSLTSTNSLTLPSINAATLAATSAAGGITLAGPLTIAGTATLNAAGDVVQQSVAPIDPTDLTIVSTGGSITLNTSIIATGTVTLSAANDIIETTAGSLSAPTLSAISQTGRVVMTADSDVGSNEVSSISGSAPLGFSFVNNGDLAVGGISTTTGAIFLQANVSEGSAGNITQTAPISGAALVALASDDVNLTIPGNSIGTVAGTAGDMFSFTNARPALTVGPVSYFSSDDTSVLNTFSGGITGSCFASCLTAVTVSNVGNLILDSVVSSGGFGNVVLAATGTFTNNVGLSAVSTSGTWQVYSASPTGDFFNGLDSVNTAVWNTTFGEPVTVPGDRYIFAFQPTITITSGDLTKSYGQDVTSLVAADFSITGLQPGVAGAFLPDTAAAVYGGIPTVTSLGSPARVSVAGSPYPITVAGGTFAVSDNYALVLDSAGRLTIDPLALTYVVADARSTYGTTPTLGAATLFGVLPGDAVDPTVGAFSGTTAVAIGPRTPAGAFSEEVTALSNSNYSVALSGNTPGTLTIDPLAITFSVDDASSVFGTTPILGPATLFGVLPGDVVIPTVDAFLGAAPIALSPFTPVGRYAQLVTAISNPNYRIAPGPNFPGVLTVSAPTANPGAPSDPGFLPGLTQINNPAQTEYDVGGYEQVLPHFTVSCNEPPSLPDPNRFSDPDQALRAISQSMENYFRRCQNPTQTTIANALDAYAAKLQVLAPRLPPALRNVPAIVAEGAKRVRAAASRAEAVTVLRQTVAAVHKEIALVLSDDPQTRGREVRDGDVIAGALGGASVALVNSGSL